MNPYKIIDILKTDAQTITEPVTLAEVKKWLKVTFSDEDSVITDIITSARETIEEFCTISIVKKEIILIVDVDYANNRSCIEFELPYGPIDITNGLSDVSVERKDGENSKTFCPGRYKITYPVGMTIIDKSLKSSILRQIADEYEHRGDDDRTQTICLSARQKAQPFKRMAWL